MDPNEGQAPENGVEQDRLRAMLDAYFDQPTQRHSPEEVEVTGAVGGVADAAGDAGSPTLGDHSDGPSDAEFQAHLMAQLRAQQNQILQQQLAMHQARMEEPQNRGGNQPDRLTAMLDSYFGPGRQVVGTGAGSAMESGLSSDEEDEASQGNFGKSPAAPAGSPAFPPAPGAQDHQSTQ